MKKYLPSKKFIYIVLSVALALLIVCLFSYIANHREKKSVLDNGQTAAEVFTSLDTDGDGVRDWEETLWKTDPKNPDTDGDGTPDGEEIIALRDPLKSNTAAKGQEPNDQVPKEIIEANKKAEQELKQLTATERVGRELFSQYIATRKIDTPLSETDKLQIIQNVISNLPPINFKTYSEKEIKIIDGSDNETLRNYSNRVAEIILNNLKTKVEGIETIFNDFSNISSDEEIKTESEVIFKRLEPLINKNKNTTTDLSTVSVPKVLAIEHLKLLNSFQEISENLELIKESTSDMIVMVPLLSHYDTSIQNLSDSVLAITEKLSSLNIAYKSNADYGYQLFSVIIKNN